MPIVIFAGETDTNEWLEDGFTLTDEARVVLTRKLEDGLYLSDDTGFKLLMHAMLTDAFNLRDQNKAGLSVRLAEILSLGDGINVSLGVALNEWLFLGETAQASVRANVTVAETLRLQDWSNFNKFFAETLLETLIFEELLRVPEAVKIVDSLQFGDLVHNTGRFGHEIRETMRFVDRVLSIFVMSIHEKLEFGDALAMKLLMTAVLRDGFVLEDDGLGSKIYHDLLTENVQLSETIMTRQLMKVFLEDGLQFETVLEIEGEPWQCWVLNTSRFHPSIYSGFSFNSYTMHDDIAYGMKYDGLYVLEDGDDDGQEIPSGAMFMPTTFGVDNKKRMRRAYLGMTTDGVPALRVETDSGTRTYTISGEKVSISKKQSGRKWKFTVQGFTTLEFIELIPVVLTR